MILIWMIAAILGIVCVDQLTKWIAVVYLQGEPSYPLWEDVLHFTFVQNKGAAFGMLSESRWVFMIVSTGAIVGILYYLIRYRPQNKWLLWGLTIIVGGGIGNMIDRVFLGYVIDFIDVTLIDFAVFNLADSFVTVGACILIVHLFVDLVKELLASRKKKRAGENVTPTETENGHEGE